MAKFIATIPIAGAIHIEVEADDEDAALEAAWGRVHEEGAEAGDVEWDYMEAIAEGNVCHAPHHRQSAQKIRGGE